MFLTTLLAQAEPAAETLSNTAATLQESHVGQLAAQNTGILSHVMGSDPIVKLVLLSLIGMSVMCWAIIIYKTRQLRSARSQSQSFWQQFSSGTSVTDTPPKGVRSGPLFEIHAIGQQTLNKIKKSAPRAGDLYLRYLQGKLNEAREEELHVLEQHIPFLATTASVSPFIGILGTVWGILSAFMKIGKSGSSALAVVGPYISEALVATAVGLFAAIPALIAYNIFVNQIKIITKMMDLFIDDFLFKSEAESV